MVVRDWAFLIWARVGGDEERVSCCFGLRRGRIALALGHAPSSREEPVRVVECPVVGDEGRWNGLGEVLWAVSDSGRPP